MSNSPDWTVELYLHPTEWKRIRDKLASHPDPWPTGPDGTIGMIDNIIEEQHLKIRVCELEEENERLTVQVMDLLERLKSLQPRQSRVTGDFHDPFSQ